MLKLAEREARGVYLERFVIMLLLLVPSVFLHGWRTAFVAAMSVLMCMVTDVVCSVIRKIPYNAKDCTVPFWGLAAALMMPSSIKVQFILLSSLLCVVVGKHLFGGSDNIVFCPPAVSTAFLIICYPADMLYFPKFEEKLAFFSNFSGMTARSVEYSLNIHNVPTSSIGDVVMGLVAGPIGAVYGGIILLCGICMAVRRSNSGISMLACLFTAGLLAFFFPRAGFSGLESVVYELFSGYLLFVLVFLSAEPNRTPTRPVGKLLYGITLGYTTMMFRFFGQTEGGALFALLITCAVCPGFDRIVENMIYWKKTYLNSYEKGVKQAENADGVKLTDTQEIVLPDKYQFNMPPIGSRVTKKRSKGKKAAAKAENEVRRLIAERLEDEVMSEETPNEPSEQTVDTSAVPKLNIEDMFGDEETQEDNSDE